MWSVVVGYSHNLQTEAQQTSNSGAHKQNYVDVNKLDPSVVVDIDDEYLTKYDDDIGSEEHTPDDVNVPNVNLSSVDKDKNKEDESQMNSVVSKSKIIP